MDAQQLEKEELLIQEEEEAINGLAGRINQLGASVEQTTDSNLRKQLRRDGKSLTAEHKARKDALNERRSVYNKRRDELKSLNGIPHRPKMICSLVNRCIKYQSGLVTISSCLASSSRFI